MGHPMKPTRITAVEIPDLVASFMATNRARFGGWSMEADPSTDPAGDDPDAGDPAPAPEPDASADPDLSDLAAVAKELGLNPGQIAGRLQASAKWEKRAKAADKGSDPEPAASEPADPEAMREQVRAEVQADHESALAETAIRGHLAGKGVETDAIETIVTALTTGLRGVITDGGVDAGKVSTLMGLFAPNAQTWPDMGRGNRGGTPSASGMDAGREAYAARRGKKN